ncbi:MAG: hypothetical protein QM759_09355 [Terricaulis sp.]
MPGRWSGLAAATLALIAGIVAYMMRASGTFMFYGILFAAVFGLTAVVIWAAPNEADRFLKRPGVRPVLGIAAIGTVIIAAFALLKLTAN